MRKTVCIRGMEVDLHAAVTAQAKAKGMLMRDWMEHALIRQLAWEGGANILHTGRGPEMEEENLRQNLEHAARRTLAASLRYTAEFVRGEVKRRGSSAEQQMQRAAMQCAAECLEKEAARLEQILDGDRRPEAPDSLKRTERIAELQRRMDDIYPVQRAASADLTYTQRNKQILAEYAGGASSQELAGRYQLHVTRISQIIRAQGGVMRMGRPPSDHLERRNHQIWKEHAKGATFDVLAKRYDITRERIHQIVAALDKEHGIPAASGAAAEAAGSE